MANEGSTKPTYSELERMAETNARAYSLMQAEKDKYVLKAGNLGVELARVRGLLQRLEWAGSSYGDPCCPECWGEHGTHKPVCELSELLEKAGTESVEMGKVNRVDESGARISQGFCDTTSTERFKVDCQCGTYEGNLGPCAKFSPDGVNGRCPYCHHTEDCHKKVAAGSAETGGEEAAPDYENDPVHKHCVGFSDWNALLYEISKFYAKIDPGWADADIDHMDEFDPWEALRKLQANFPRSPQNQTVSSGVEGAHEGTTADKSVALAESSLSSPPPEKE